MCVCEREKVGGAGGGRQIDFDNKVNDKVPRGRNKGRENDKDRGKDYIQYKIDR